MQQGATMIIIKQQGNNGKNNNKNLIRTKMHNEHETTLYCYFLRFVRRSHWNATPPT
jgi:hypothetical protein